MSDFDLKHFMAFTQALRIDSKELGVIRLGENLLGTQRWFLRAMTKGFEDGCRNFVTLKCRQIGLSTISLAIDLYWIFKYKALTGALVVHDDPAREQFRQTLGMYCEGLPPEWRRPIRVHNRNHIVFGHGSRLQYKVAGTTSRKASGSLGRSSALAFLHATEMSSWGDEEGLASLRSSLAENNPIRFYHWESTARGFNLFYDMWEEAKKAVSQRAIFVSFWANEFYRSPRDSDVWRAYWGKNGRLTPEERSWVRDVRSLYDVEVDDEQVAWYRWKIAESVGGELMVQQEFPPTEHHAFLATGSQFFGARAISEAIKRVKNQDDPEFFRIEFKANFWETEIVQSSERQATLRIWEHPQTGSQYVIGADPAYGSADTRDNYVVSVWRCFGDKIVQVAEFCDGDLTTYAFAWAMCWLAGAYEPCLVNLEINGPGQVVYNEIQNLKKVAALKLAPQSRALMNVVRNIQNFLFKRIDQISGAPNALHWQTTLQSKERAMNTYRDYFERGIAVPRSYGLVDEMKGIQREEGKAPEASSRTHDDRVSGASLAVVAWAEMLMIRLSIMGMGYDHSMLRQGDREQQAAVGSDVGNRLVQNMMNRVGFTR